MTEKFRTPQQKPHRELTPEQRRAAEADYNPLLIVAGAGTGKTLTLTSRFTHLLQRGANPGSICAVTFTNKAAREMEERITAMTPSLGFASRYAIRLQGDRPFIGTFHSLGARILRAESKYLERSPNFVIFDEDDSLRLVKKILKAKRGTKDGPAVIRERISKFKNHSGEATKIDVSIFETYEAALAANNAFDFDDLIQKVVMIFQGHPEILEKYQNRWPHILVDEYQDINLAQYELVKTLANNFSARNGSLSVVGDDQQMIYSWRGSRIETFLNFEHDWPNTTTTFLEENFRSTPQIVTVASSVMQENRYQTDSLRRKGLRTKNSDGEPVRLVELYDDTHEAEWIASEIGNLKGEDQGAEIAILYRTNAQSRAIEQALIAQDIPYNIFGGLKFYDRREVKDVIAALRFVMNPKDEISHERLQKTFTKSRFLELMTSLRDVGQDATPETVIAVFLKSAHYFEYLRNNFPNAEEREENIVRLSSFAANFHDLPSFLEQVALVEAHDESGNSAKENITPVILTTVHLAKGLEFDRVFLAGACEGLVPHARSFGNNEQMEEERRLLYVAMTRARRNLVISFYNLPSRFLSDVPERHIAFQSFTGNDLSLDAEERYITLD